MACAVGLFLYQTLDGMDGNQARRIGLSNPLGEFFDHGLDAILTFMYAAVSACSVGINQNCPLLGLWLCVTVLMLNFFYHWQTFVSGVLHFKMCVHDKAMPSYSTLCILNICALHGVIYSDAYGRV